MYYIGNAVGLIEILSLLLQSKVRGEQVEIIGTLLMFLGCIGVVIGGIWFLIETFKTGVLWGLCCLFIPFVSLIWLVMHWQQGSKPFLLQLAGAGVAVLGATMGGAV